MVTRKEILEEETVLQTPQKALEYRKRERSETAEDLEKDLVQEFIEKFSQHRLKPSVVYLPSRNSFRFDLEGKKKGKSHFIRVPNLNKARIAADERNLDRAFSSASEMADDLLLELEKRYK
jgi:hypothetical protein